MSNNQASISLPVRAGEIIGGKYRIDGPLGRGGMGVVASAVHLDLDQRVAIKFLSADHAGDSDCCRRFTREARLAVKIRSPHVVRVLDVGALDSGLPYIVMELLHGEDAHVVRKRRGFLPVAEAVECVVQVCEAAASAHALGIVHRDLKPSNLFLTEDSHGQRVVKVLDFGISKFVSDDDPITKLTSPHTVLGSLSYMSPEQIRSVSDVDHRADIWSLGVILYELLSGKRPFRSRETEALVGVILSEPPAPLRDVNPDVPEELESVILRCLEKDVKSRIQSAAELAEALAPFRPDGARPFQIPPSRDSMSARTMMTAGARRPSPLPPAPPGPSTGPQEPTTAPESRAPVETQVSSPSVSITVSRRALRIGILGATAAVLVGMATAVFVSRSSARTAEHPTSSVTASPSAAVSAVQDVPFATASAAVVQPPSAPSAAVPEGVSTAVPGGASATARAASTGPVPAGQATSTKVLVPNVPVQPAHTSQPPPPDPTTAPAPEPPPPPSVASPSPPSDPARDPILDLPRQ